MMKNLEYDKKIKSVTFFSVILSDIFNRLFFRALHRIAQSAGAVEYTDCNSAEG